MNRLSILLFACLITLPLAGVPAVAADDLHTFRTIDPTRPLGLDFGDYRIRVDGWTRDYVEVEVVGRALTPLSATCEGNIVRFQAEQFQQPLWEPAFRIRVPRALPVRITAGEVWAKDCTVADLNVRLVAYVRDCTLQTAHRPQWPLSLRLWHLFHDHHDGWQAIRFK